MATTTLGGTTLAAPLYDHSGSERSHEDVGAAHEMADGSTVYDYVGTRYAWSLEWQHITEAQKIVIEALALVKTTQVFSPPDTATTYNVRVVPNTYTDTYIEDGDATERFNVTLGLVGVAVV